MPKNKKTSVSWFTYPCKFLKQLLKKQLSYGTFKFRLIIALVQLLCTYQNSRLIITKTANISIYFKEDKILQYISAIPI